MNAYRVIEHIGDGAHGHVIKAYATNMNDKVVALKKIHFRKYEEEIPTTILREIKTLLTVECKYVIRLIDYFPYECGVVLVLEFMPTGLWEMLHDLENPTSTPVLKTYMRMLLKGVNFLHECGIMHRDLKPANLLVSHEGILKIADLGLSRVIWSQQEHGRPYTHQVATRWYRAPELLYGSRFYDQSVDLWAVGCIFAEMISKTPLFPGENDIEQLAMVIRSLGTPTSQTWPDMKQLPDYHKITFTPSVPKPFESLIPDADNSCVDLIKSFLQYDGKKRTTARKALSHTYFFQKPLPCPERQMPPQKDDHRNKIKNQLRSSQTYAEYFDEMYSFLVPPNG